MPHQYRCGKRGRQLLTDAIARYRRDLEIELLYLSVSTESTAARHLYASAGFRPYGLESGAIKRGDRYLAAELLMLDVRRAG